MASSSTTEANIVCLAGGFTLGFGLFTVWLAIKQTRRNRRPWTSTYIYMIWGEIFVNLCIGILSPLIFFGALPRSIPPLFFLMVFWSLEIQLLLQIIINRVAIIAEHRSTVRRLKWATLVVVSCISVVVVMTFVPAQLVPPASDFIVRVDGIWHRVSKGLILIIDAGLNYYFMRIVKNRLATQHGLVKYAPLVGFNAKLMVLSVSLDGLLIGLVSIQDDLVHIQFQPAVYMAKLHIEMTMANLITRLAQGGDTKAGISLPSWPGRADTDAEKDGGGGGGGDVDLGDLGTASATGGRHKLDAGILVETVVTTTTTSAPGPAARRAEIWAPGGGGGGSPTVEGARCAAWADEDAARLV